jgi:hypothetical protein
MLSSIARLLLATKHKEISATKGTKSTKSGNGNTPVPSTVLCFLCLLWLKFLCAFLWLLFLFAAHPILAPELLGYKATNL